MELPVDRLPVLLRHMALAVFLKMRGGEQKRFMAAMEISRARLVELRHLTPPSKEGPLERIQLTSSGMKLERVHMKEGGAKNAKFKLLYEKYRANLETKAIKEVPE